MICPSCEKELTPDSRYCSRCGAGVSDLSTAEGGSGAFSAGERKPVTILFADIVGSTAIAEALDPEEWREVVQGAHARGIAAVERFGGMVAQLEGDGLLAYFGAPVTHEDDPERAVRAALDLQESLRDYRRELEGLVENLQIRVGIHSGEVVLGELGSGSHREYLAVGDSVNTAARIQSKAEPGTVLISGPVKSKVAHAFELVELGPLDLKGKSGRVTAFRVQALKDKPERGRGFAELETPFVGREVELERLTSTLHGLLQGQGGIVAILGEAGIGKTRLVEEARSQLTGESREAAEAAFEVGDLRWLEGRALSYGGSLSYWVITQLILDDLGLSDGAPEVRIKVALRKRVEALFGQEAGENWPYLAHLFGMKLDEQEEDYLQSLDSESRRYQTKVVLRRYFECIADAGPLGLVLEDLHWADPSSLDVLEELLELSDHAPILMLFLMRMEHDHGSWALTNVARTHFPHRYEEIHLRRLLAAESGLLIQGIVGGGELPDELEGLIQSRAEGNPYYVEEVVRHLIERELLTHVGGRWEIQGEVDRLGIPETLQGVILARIDRLEEDVRETLQLASVIGRSFLYRILAAISEAEEELQGHLTELQRSELVREKQRLPELEYIFKHALTQEATYDSLLRERRKTFHLHVGEAIESLFADRREEFSGLLAYHFEQAGDVNKAARYLVDAGDIARLEDALLEADDFYSRAIQNLVELDDQEAIANLWMKRGLVYQAMSSYEKAHEAYAAAFELLQVQRKRELARPIEQQASLSEVKREFRIPELPGFRQINLDKIRVMTEVYIFLDLFASLVDLDVDLNVIPCLAKSWEILDGGKRYVFHLRDDIRWSDGKRITAEDYVWTVMYKLDPDREGQTTLLDDILGAIEYRTGEAKDAAQVGVRAIDDVTLEMKLRRPTSYFLYIMTMVLGCPLPGHIIDEHGDEWWRPPHVVTSGAFSLSRMDDDGAVLERNPLYFRKVKGNLERVSVRIYPTAEKVSEAYIRSEVDFSTAHGGTEWIRDLPESDIETSPRMLVTGYLLLNPEVPPTNSRLCRRAIAHAVNKQAFVESWAGIYGLAEGGVVPPGMPGHSPGISLSYDVQIARGIFKEYSDSEFVSDAVLTIGGIQRVIGRGRHWLPDVAREISEAFKIETEVNIYPDHPTAMDEAAGIHLSGWVADFPDPVNFLVYCIMESLIELFGWDDDYYNSMARQASIELNREKRMSICRKMDHYLVEEQVLVIPLGYGLPARDYVKPWVHNFRRNPLGRFRSEDIVIDDPDEGQD